ncbi:kinase-like domain-containing protein [Suillus placidus]|uniref:Kinase-like domain-containing protein n=1 Tax=Suillus placidus TaxID=48579 RepID=A0A9P7A6D8_9AGAM|nr:kinase-like domain-containing protein [Suillus placidus]
MSNDGTLNSQPCRGLDNDFDGCGVIFPRMSPGTLHCQLCKKLKKEGLTGDEVAHIKCGICGTNMSDPCGTCKRKGRLHWPLGPSTPESELSNLRENNGKPGSVTIYVECRLSHKPGSVDRTLGTYCAPYAETMSFIDSGVGMMSLHDRYNKYNHPQTRASHIQVPAGALKGNKSGRAISLELFIDTDQYEERTSEDHSGSTDVRKSTSSCQKAKRTRENGTLLQTSAAKRLRADENAILTSSFWCDTVTRLPASVSISDKITFQRTICTTDQDGKYTLTEQGATEQGFLAHNTLFLSAADRGKTKDVYLLIIENQEYVAKKLFDVGQGRGQLTIQDACKFLTADLIRLKRLSYFETKFTQQVIQEGVDAAAFQVSDGFIIKTYSDAGQVVDVEAELQTPISEDIIPTHEPTSIYLVEPRRVSSAVLKFSGTLGVRNRTDKRSATIMAFSHFILESSACEYMFADLQGSIDRGILCDTESVLTMFDPMTHTPLGESGLGDHGFEGIHDFADSHECSAICRSLKLCEMSVIQNTLRKLEEEVTVDSDEEV